MKTAMKELYDRWETEFPDWRDKSKFGIRGHYMNGKSFGDGFCHHRSCAEYK